ncbi:DUF4190 domain-containing protein [Mesobacillus maritimus]|uniref:DUF4190 domain-containing protein n=1 Tax=Mesobacillus maritimus TaxID=1643336 RepID=UPI002041E346|nr:DUF4190 domain-containing protein [Mesobacillus maritimus]MCM3671712.1 DUF4190 domain-containing protein [Mesobacillus maritimus]
MADDLRNQDKPGYLNEPEHDYLQNNINAERAGSSAPTASTQPSENKVDYTQVSGMNTGSQAQSSNKTDSTNGEKTYLQNNINAERADSSTPTASALPSENNVDYNQVSGMDTGSQAQLSRETESMSTYGEETAAEIAAPVSLGRDRQSEADNDQETMKARSGIIGISALVISILSLFVLPIVLGITGVVLGFVARKRGGAKGLANWAIGIGAISIIIGMFVLPFY